MFRVTRALSVGRFASPRNAGLLLAAGVTHVLNVSDAPNVVVPGPGSFTEVVWEPLTDFRRIPEHRLVRILHELHRLAGTPGARVYVHCLAGIQRSPTVLWLYLIACGLPPDVARDWIETASPDANPGLAALSDFETVLFAQTHFPQFSPPPRADILSREW